MINQACKVLSPILLADAMLVSSSAIESVPEYAVGTTYGLGATVKLSSSKRIYESLQDGNVGHSPTDDPNLWWLDKDPTNQWAMFDDVVGTETTALNTLTVVLRPGRVSGLALLELTGQKVTVTMTATPGGEVVYSSEKVLDQTPIKSIYDWFFLPYEAAKIAIFSDLPRHFSTCELTITITGLGTVGCGVCKVGEIIGLGGAQYGATSDIISYDRKDVDPEFGRVTIVKRGFSKRMNLKVIIEKSDYTRIANALAKIRSTATVWIATEAPGYEPLIIYGFYKSCPIEVAYSSIYYCSLEIEGLI